MTLTVTQMAILIVLALVALELVKLGTRYFFARITKDDYVTTAALEKKCKDCWQNNDRDRTDKEHQLDGLCQDMKEMKQILLIVALKNEISPEDLKALVR
jgi:hypothetical protein